MRAPTGHLLEQRSLYSHAEIKLLGFKDRKELAFEDNVKHSYFIYPDEMVWRPAGVQLPKLTYHICEYLSLTLEVRGLSALS